MTEEIKNQILQMGRQARSASHQLSQLSSAEKNTILSAMANGIETHATDILSANEKDLAAGKKNGLTPALLDRLTLTSERLQKIADSVRDIIALPDPVGETLTQWTLPNGLEIQKQRVPIGVIGIIYESRPNVTVDAAVLCFKSGNATILRGGSEAIHSNRALAQVLQKSAEAAGLPKHSIQLIPFTDRESIQHMAQMDTYLDLIIPRGGHGLIETVVSLARMPVIKHYHGVCHTYIDKSADLQMAKDIALNAKTQRPGVCNAMETLLVHRDIADAVYRDLGQAYLDAGVELRGDETVQQALGDKIKAVTPEDWTAEYLDLILAVKTVDSLDHAIEHINQYGSKHSDTIVTNDAQAAESFLNRIDSSAVLHNASTRFNDGGEFGFGAEIGISTDKLHARGPMALPELTSYKYKVRGDGQIRK